jgi:hypothetical protein
MRDPRIIRGGYFTPASIDRSPRFGTIMHGQAMFTAMRLRVPLRPRRRAAFSIPELSPLACRWNAAPC